MRLASAASWTSQPLGPGHRTGTRASTELVVRGRVDRLPLRRRLARRARGRLAQVPVPAARRVSSAPRAFWAGCGRFSGWGQRPWERGGSVRGRARAHGLRTLGSGPLAPSAAGPPGRLLTGWLRPGRSNRTDPRPPTAAPFHFSQSLAAPLLLPTQPSA